MRFIYLISSFLLIIVLAYLFFYSDYEYIDNLYELSKLQDNSFVKTFGKVISENYYGEYKTLKLNNNITIQISKSSRAHKTNYLNKNIKIYGQLDTYNSPKIISRKIIVSK